MYDDVFQLKISSNNKLFVKHFVWMLWSKNEQSVFNLDWLISWNISWNINFIEMLKNFSFYIWEVADHDVKIMYSKVVYEFNHKNIKISKILLKLTNVYTNALTLS